jgi:hypothetical protein
MGLRTVTKDDRFEYVDNTLALNHRKKDAIHGITEFYSSADIDKTRLPAYQERVTNRRSMSRTEQVN